MNALNRLLGIEHALIQAPMAGVQKSGLALAVSAGGGLGSLPCAMLGPDALRSEIETIRAQTGRPYNLNFFCHRPPAVDVEREQRWLATLAPYYAELGLRPPAAGSAPTRQPFSAAIVDVIEAYRPPILSFHFGLPEAALLDRVRGWGAKILASATTVAEARWLVAHGADAVIAQGLEAGGHRGHFLSDDLNLQRSTMALVPQIVDAVDVPVIAAGGIADARGVAAACALGAAGVQIGTAYLLCPEAETTALHRAALADADAPNTLTNLLTGRPARGLVNRLMRELGALRDDVPEFPLGSNALAPLRAEAERRGRSDFSSLWAGHNVSACRTISATELTRELIAGLPG